MLFLEMTSIGKTLLLCGAALSVLVVVFQNIGIFPLETGDFLFFFVLATLIASYRPGWMFLLLLMSLPFEMTHLSPMTAGPEVRPYQFLEVALYAGLILRFLARQALPELPKFGVPDGLLLLVPVGSLFSLWNAPSVGLSLKLSLVLFSLYGLYLLSRIYLRSIDDIRKVLPFVLASGSVVLLYSVVQNIRFLSGSDPFEVMPGRPDGGFPEPDWLGMYLVFLGSVLFAFGTSFRAGEGRERVRMAGQGTLLFAVLSVFFSVLLMTVSRSAWLGALVSGALSVLLLAYVRRSMKAVTMYVVGISSAFLLAVVLVACAPLTRFDLLGRAASTAGSQEITVSCVAGGVRSGSLPDRISDVSELAPYGCRHIDIEEIEGERSRGNLVTTVLRPDPNVNIRKEIYRKSWQELRSHPLLGIGWGSISSVLGVDARGAGLNASNVLFEVWLGSGVLGLFGLLGFLAVVSARSLREIRSRTEPADATFPSFVLSALFGILVFDLFNSGILLGFIWVLFAAFLVVSRNQLESDH